MNQQPYRRPLPMRRRSETFELSHGELNYFITTGHYRDGSVGEVFINFPKSGMQAEAIARDSAVLLSLALQYGMPLDSVSGAITRNYNAEASSIVGAVVDRLVKDRME